MLHNIIKNLNIGKHHNFLSGKHHNLTGRNVRQDLMRADKNLPSAMLTNTSENPRPVSKLIDAIQVCIVEQAFN